MKNSSSKPVRIRDRRHHAPPLPDDEKAADLLHSLAQRAVAESGYLFSGDRYRYRQRNREKYPDAYENRPGALIEERCSAEEREILRSLKSDPDARLEPFMKVIIGGL